MSTLNMIEDAIDDVVIESDICTLNAYLNSCYKAWDLCNYGQTGNIICEAFGKSNTKKK